MENQFRNVLLYHNYTSQNLSKFVVLLVTYVWVLWFTIVSAMLSGFSMANNFWMVALYFDVQCIIEFKRGSVVSEFPFLVIIQKLTVHELRTGAYVNFAIYWHTLILLASLFFHLLGKELTYFSLLSSHHPYLSSSYRVTWLPGGLLNFAMGDLR